VRRTPAYRKAAPYIPHTARTLGKRLAFRTTSTAEAPLAEARGYLRTRQLSQTEELRALLSRNFPEWQTLYGSS